MAACGIGDSANPNLANATFVGNDAADQGDGIFKSNPSATTLRSTIVADGCNTAVTSVGTGNLQDPAVTGTCGLTSALPGFIGPLQPNGGVIGPTSSPVPQLTQAIGFAGAALDTTAGDCLDHTGAVVASDERGVGRPFDAFPAAPGSGCDSGAFEMVTCALSTVDGPDAITGTVATETLTGTSGDDQIYADAGNDTVLAGAGDDTVCGADGNDSVQGEADTDRLSGGLGTDLLDGGGAVTDTADYLESPAGVTVSLEAGSANGGEGLDTLLGLENVTGSTFDDTITGDAGANILLAGTLTGSSGDDDILSGGVGPGPDGDDIFFGGSDPTSVDTVRYAARTDDVTVSMATEPGMGGDSLNVESDQLNGIENAVAGSGDDLLIGSNGANSLTGGPGADTVNGQNGPDLLFVRDGEADTAVGCGADNGVPDVDIVQTDEEGVDTLSQCQDPPDIIDFIVPPVQPPPDVGNTPITPIIPITPVTPVTPEATPVKKCKKGQKRKKVKGKVKCVKKKGKKK